MEKRACSGLTLRSGVFEKYADSNLAIVEMRGQTKRAVHRRMDLL